MHQTRRHRRRQQQQQQLQQDVCVKGHRELMLAQKQCGE
jgi:hypothetical protein